MVARLNLVLLIAVLSFLSTGCEEKDLSGSTLVLAGPQVMISVGRQFDLDRSKSKAVNVASDAARDIDRWATTLSLAPNGKSLVAIEFGQSAVYFDDIRSESVGLPVKECRSPSSICVWASDSSAFVLFDAPDRLWGELKLFDIETLNVVASAKLDFALGALSLTNDTFLVFRESGEQFSSTAPWRPQLFQIGSRSITPLTPALPTENCPSMGSVFSIGKMPFLLTGSRSLVAPLELWLLPLDSRSESLIPQKGIVEGVSKDSPKAMLQEFAINSRGDKLATLWQRSDEASQNDFEFVEAYEISLRDKESKLTVLGCRKQWESDPFSCAFDEIIVPDLTEHRVAFLCKDLLIGVAASEELRLYSAETGRLLKQFKVPHCNVLSTMNSPSEVLVSTTDRFTLLKIECRSESSPRN